MLSIIDTEVAAETDEHIARTANVKGPVVSRLSGSTETVYVATNPTATALYVGTVDEMAEAFEDNFSNLVPVCQYVNLTVANIALPDGAYN